jgi:Tfp pilus assembly protein PilX
MCKRSFHIIRNEKGIALLIALMVLIMLSLMGLAAILTSTTDVQIAGNEAHSTQALYLAEAGVSQVKSWFENPTSFNPPAGSYTLDANNNMAPFFNTDMKSLFKKRRTDITGVPNYLNNANLSQFTDINKDNTITAADANNAIDDGLTTDQNNNRTGDHPVLSIKAPPETGGTAAGDTYLNDPTTGLFKNLSSMGRVTVLEIYPPMSNTNFATVRVKAVDAAGASRTIEQEIGPSDNFAVGDGLSAQGAAGWNGNGSVHWGPVVTAGNVTVGQNSLHCLSHTVCGGPDDISSGNGQADKWWSLDAQGTIAAQGVTLPDPNYAITQNSTKTPETLSTDQKAALKQYSLDTGQYYVYCSTDGLLHKGNGSGLPTGAGTSFQNLTNGKSFSMLFVDIGATDPSCNSSPPSMPTFSVGGGGGYYTASNIILNGTFSISGSGGTTAITAQNPDQVDSGSGTTPLNVHINGLIYTTGNFNSSGNPVVYGAVVAEGGFTGSGTPDIWYNKNLANGLPALPLTSTQGWREIRPP